MEFLKPILGEELYTAAAAKLAESQEVKLANLASGAYVGKEKFLAVTAKAAALETALKQAEEKLAAADEKLAAASGALQKTAELEAALIKCAKEKELMGKQFEQKLMALEKKAAVENALLAAEAKNMKAVRALIDDSRLVYADGKLTGLTEQIEAVRQSDPYLFNLKGDTGGGSNPSASGEGLIRTNPDRLDDKTFYNIKFKK